METLSQSLGKAGSWGKADSIERRNAISKLMDFLNEATNLFKEHPTLEREIICPATYNSIYRLIPRNIQDYIIDKDLPTSSIEASFKLLEETLLKHRQMTILRIKRSDIFDKKANDSFDKKANDSKLVGKKFSSNNVSLVNNHDCAKSHQCKTDWDFLGCIKLYSMKKADERRDLMVKNKICFRCSGMFKMNRFVRHR